jgi:hypothetical protein
MAPLNDERCHNIVIYHPCETLNHTMLDANLTHMLTPVPWAATLYLSILQDVLAM